MFKRNSNSDVSAVKQLKEGSEAAFDELFRKYSKKMYHVSRKMGLGHEDAEGVVQEIFIKIWKNRGRLDSSLSFNAYLIAILRSIVIRQIQRKAKLTAYMKYSFEHFDEKDTQTEDHLVFSEMMTASSKALDTLPPRQRQVFMMKNLEDLSLDEIAERLSVSKKTVKNQVFRATKAVREKLQDQKIISLFLAAAIHLAFFAD